MTITPQHNVTTATYYYDNGRWLWDRDDSPVSQEVSTVFDRHCDDRNIVDVAIHVVAEWRLHDFKEHGGDELVELNMQQVVLSPDGGNDILLNEADATTIFEALYEECENDII